MFSSLGNMRNSLFTIQPEDKFEVYFPISTLRWVIIAKHFKTFFNYPKFKLCFPTLENWNKLEDHMDLICWICGILQKHEETTLFQWRTLTNWTVVLWDFSLVEDIVHKNIDCPHIDSKRKKLKTIPVCRRWQGENFNDLFHA